MTNGAAKWIAHWRVRLGYVLAIVVLFFARPKPRGIMIGAAIGIIGLWLRAYAAGYLKKQEVLTTTGPYAYTRNPLYLGSSVLAAGAAWATQSVASAAVLLIYFGVVYYVVMRREERELRGHFGEAFDRYAQAVPLFFPRVTPARLSHNGGAFSFAQYTKNHEYEAALGFFLVLLVLVGIWFLRFRAH